MSKKWLEDFLPDLEEFRKNLKEFDEGKITVAEYKGLSGGFGSYAQRGGKRHMLRLRLPGGVLSKEHLKFIVDSCEKYHIDLIKLTTCQSVQLHNLKAEDLPQLMEAAWKEGMISRGSGGDFPRNVMASPLSGVRKGETFDVMPYAKAAGDYLMNFIKAVKFPRKLKCCFSNCEENEVHATFRDLGFVAKENHKFDVYGAGGLGIQPSLGILLAKDVEPEEIRYYINAMVDTFVTFGNYENRGRSRTRFLKERLGEEGLCKEYDKMLQKIRKEENLDLKKEEIEETKITKQGKGRIEDKRAIEQKQTGLYAVSYHPIAGEPSVELFRKISETIEPMEEVELRLTPQAGMYIINLNSEEAKQILQLTKDGAGDLFEESVCCIGATTCQVGIGDSPALLKQCVERIRKENFKDGVLPKIYISGCPSSCGTHQIGTLGFRGAIKQTSDGPKKAFAVFVGGRQQRGREQLSEPGKIIEAEKIPEFLVELGRAVSKENTSYSSWMKNHKNELEGLIDKYSG